MSRAACPGSGRNSDFASAIRTIRTVEVLALRRGRGAWLWCGRSRSDLHDRADALVESLAGRRRAAGEHERLVDPGERLVGSDAINPGGSGQQVGSCLGLEPGVGFDQRGELQVRSPCGGAADSRRSRAGCARTPHRLWGCSHSSSCAGPRDASSLIDEDCQHCLPCRRPRRCLA
jgi:hypothetical protein